ncbi:MAG TPA: MarR family transcriptional regulator [Solirubrobacteraceae bacterium]|nr:MarR family transcriptional regulator [Solirubrobacteraceae bacterium]
MQQVEELIREFRVSSNQDHAFDSLAAERLGVSETDLRCLNIIENSGGLSAGELAAQAGLTAGAITGVVDRLERVGFARRRFDPADRRRVGVEVTPGFCTSAERIWGPLAADWHSMLAKRFTVGELERITDFLRLTNHLGRQHIDRLRRDSPAGATSGSTVAGP